MAIMDVIKYDGTANRDWIVYKYPGHEFNTKSKLIVGVGQIAVCVHGGKVESIFESGTVTLNTENLPFIKAFVKGLHGGNTPYTMEVYFINKRVKLDMLWGTTDPIQMLDPKFNVKVNVRARGQMGIRVSDYQYFLTNLIGTIGNDGVIDFGILQNYFRSLINTKIKTLIGNYLITNKISTMDVSIYLEEMSASAKEKLDDEFAKFGLDLVNFFIESISVPDEDLEKINKFLNKKAEFDIVGDARYEKSRSYDVLETAAGNEGGGLASAGVGLGVGLGVAKAASSMTGETIVADQTTIVCPNCGGKTSANAKFCPGCGIKFVRCCPKCGTGVKIGTKFCPECGEKLM